MRTLSRIRFLYSAWRIAHMPKTDRWVAIRKGNLCARQGSRRRAALQADSLDGLVAQLVEQTAFDAPLN